VILINYATNDAIHPTNASDLRASMTQGLEALRKAAPGAHLFFIIPFGQYRVAEIRATVERISQRIPATGRFPSSTSGPTRPGP
jgi:hypothetical protein